MSRVVLHVDMDAFFAAVEQREDPALRGLPVIVGADPAGGAGRGVVAACSYEARRFGIHSAQPISQAYLRCPQGVYLRPNGRLYATTSKAIMRILAEFSDRVESISIDEAFLDVTGSLKLFGSARRIAQDIKKRIHEEQRLTASVGVAASKFIAKIASDLEKPDGLVVVAAGTEKEFLKDLPVRRIWGVGPRTEERLQELGIQTVGQVAERSEAYWAHQLGRHGVHLWRLSHGRDERPVVAQQGFKSLSHERTFSRDTADLELISQTLLHLSEEVCRRCREHSARGRCLTLKWRFADFSTLTRQATLQEATNDPGTVYRILWGLVEKFLPLPQRVRLVGVSVSRFSEAPPAQMSLFDSPRQKNHQDSLNASIDAINARFGMGKVKKASLLSRQEDKDEGFSSFLIR